MKLNMVITGNSIIIWKMATLPITIGMIIIKIENILVTILIDTLTKRMKNRWNDEISGKCDRVKTYAIVKTFKLNSAMLSRDSY